MLTKLALGCYFRSYQPLGWKEVDYGNRLPVGSFCLMPVFQRSCGSLGPCAKIATNHWGPGLLPAFLYCV